jgi:hypothetical protein
MCECVTRRGKNGEGGLACEQREYFTRLSGLFETCERKPGDRVVDEKNTSRTMMDYVELDPSQVQEQRPNRERRSPGDECSRNSRRSSSSFERIA